MVKNKMKEKERNSVRAKDEKSEIPNFTLKCESCGTVYKSKESCACPKCQTCKGAIIAINDRQILENVLDAKEAKLEKALEELVEAERNFQENLPAMQNETVISFISSVLKQGKLYCPHCKQSKLEWTCCHTSL